MKQIISILLFLSITIAYSQNITMQEATYYRCEPDKFFDSGGEFESYADNESFTTTICPQNTNGFLKLDFINFSTQFNQDILTIYDGDNINANIIGSYSGVTTPGYISASESNTSGCLTFVFTSNGSGTTTGWEADILCGTCCQDIVASIDNTVPETNPGYNFTKIVPNESVDFFGSASFSTDNTNASYHWDFGDGNTATGTNVSHLFTTAGKYTVTLTVTDDNPTGCSNSTTFQVFVIGPNIIVDQDIFTTEQLIEDVLVESPCAGLISNINWSTGINFAPLEPNGIGYFTGDGGLFPFEDGILLTTGDASEARGPNNVSMHEGTFGWPGDSDLDEHVNLEDYLDPALEYGAYPLEANNATFIQFDFTPISNTISLDFILAYEGFNLLHTNCRQVSDVAAILLTDNMGNTTNLAVLPGTPNPILISNIYYVDHPVDGCSALNEAYFEGYIPQNEPPMSFDGRSVLFTAQSEVIPGDHYTLKIVIADVESTNFDAGIFLKGKSLNLGGSDLETPDLGEDITIALDTAECYGSAITLDTNIPTATHTWYYAADPTMPENTLEIIGETGSTINVTEPGIYSVETHYSNICYDTDTILIEFKTTPIAHTPNNLTICHTDSATPSFYLTENNDAILGTQNADDFIISYHLSESDAINHLNPLPANYNNIANPQIIWARIANPSQTCFDTISFSIFAESQLIVNSIPDLELCSDLNNANNTFIFDLTENEDVILNALNDITISYYKTANDADSDINPISNPTMYAASEIPEQNIFVRVTNNMSSCYTVISFKIKVHPLPEFNLEDTYVICSNPNTGDNLSDPLVIDTGLSEINYTFQWRFEGQLITTETVSTIQPTTGGMYEVSITNINTNCSTTRSTLVIESGAPTLVVNTSNTVFSNHQTIEAIATGIADSYEYSLDGGVWQDEGFFNNVTRGSHHVSARDKNGCEITTVQVYIVGYPSFFTPNGDGHNDTWKIEGLETNATIYIFNRYNKLITQLQPQEGWDGTLNGKDLPTNDYWFTVDYIEPTTGITKTFKSHFTLKR